MIETRLIFAFVSAQTKNVGKNICGVGPTVRGIRTCQVSADVAATPRSYVIAVDRIIEVSRCASKNNTTSFEILHSRLRIIGPTRYMH